VFAMATVSIPQEPLPFPFKMENGKKITYVDPFLEDTFVVNTSVFMCDDPTQFQIEMRRCFSSIRNFSDEEIEVFRSGKKIDDLSSFMKSLIQGGITDTLIKEKIFLTKSVECESDGLMFFNSDRLPTVKVTNQIFISFCSQASLKFRYNVDYVLFIFGLLEVRTVRIIFLSS